MVELGGGQDSFCNQSHSIRQLRNAIEPMSQTRLESIGESDANSCGWKSVVFDVLKYIWYDLREKICHNGTFINLLYDYESKTILEVV